LCSIHASFNGTVTALGLSLDSPLEEVLGALHCHVVRFFILPKSAILSLSGVSGLRNIDELPCFWLEQLNNSSISSNFQFVSFSFVFDSFELLGRKVFTCIKSAGEIFRSFIVRLFLCFLYFFFRDLGNSSFLGFFVIIVIGG